MSWKAEHIANIILWPYFKLNNMVAETQDLSSVNHLKWGEKRLIDDPLFFILVLYTSIRSQCISVRIQDWNPWSLFWMTSRRTGVGRAPLLSYLIYKFNHQSLITSGWRHYFAVVVLLSLGTVSVSELGFWTLQPYIMKYHRALFSHFYLAVT